MAARKKAEPSRWDVPDGAIEKPWGWIVVTDEGDVPVIKDRALYVADEDFSLAPDTLVGSHFLTVSDGVVIWRGAVVGEPQPGKYLVHIDVLEAGASNVQRMFSLDTMMGLGDDQRRLIEGAVDGTTAPVVAPRLEWRFYDSAEAAQEAYREWANVATLRDRAEEPV